MNARRTQKLAVALLVAALCVALPLLADEIKGKVKSIDRTRSEIVVADEKLEKDVTVSVGRLSKGEDLRKLKEGMRVTIESALVAASLAIDGENKRDQGPRLTILQEFWHNFRHNLFKPLLLFFYLGFLVPILNVEFEFPYVIYQALTIYLLLAIGWHGGEELAKLDVSSVKSIVGFMGVGFVTNLIVGVAAYIALKVACPRMRRVDQATVAGYYGSDSAGTFVTCLGVLGTAQIAYDAYMPVMLAIMEIPGCLVALYLVSRLRHNGMDARGNMPDEPGFDPGAKPLVSNVGEPGHHPTTEHERAVEMELELSLEKTETVHHDYAGGLDRSRKKPGLINGKLLHEVFLNTGLYLLFGGIVIGLVSRAQGPTVTREDDNFFINLFQGVLCLFLLEMGMTASRKLKDLKSGGPGFIAFALIAPNLFATLGILVAHSYARITGTHFEVGSYVLFAVLCGAASYIAVPAVQRLAIPEASPTLPLAASLGLTFSYNVTIGIPVYIVITQQVMSAF
jgi:uncharacterized protein